jgi:pilus assembly protein Flp/PilA
MMKKTIKALWKDESGVTAIEYGLIAGLMAAVLVVVLGVFSDKLKDLFDAISGKLEETTDNINAQ